MDQDSYVNETIFEGDEKFVEVDLNEPNKNSTIKPLEIEKVQIKKIDSEEEVQKMINETLKKSDDVLLELKAAIKEIDLKPKKKRFCWFKCCTT